ncbi:hypothetical protein HYS82_00205 [Candidatus Amesbacteria bacterium]|nr:hypothetical protein [Candidatus Amesbacteria bacterium]MBI2587478.1 hypothetical protein [Candidatus Amesbacteria bacterium]
MDKTSQNILIGSILGDGHLDKPTKNGSRWILKYDDKCLEYLLWLHDKLLGLESSEVKPKKNYHQHYFSTKPSLEVGRFRRIFYLDGKKIVPEEIGNWLVDPLSLAVWYMDDGNLDRREKYHLNANIATYCFSYKECELLVKTLKSNFEVEARVHKCTMRGVRRYRLYIVSRSMDRFIKLVGPYIQPCLAYKIAL